MGYSSFGRDGLGDRTASVLQLKHLSQRLCYIKKHMKSKHPHAMIHFTDSGFVDVEAELLGAEVLEVVDVTVLKSVVEENVETVVDEEVDEAPTPTCLRN